MLNKLFLSIIAVGSLFATLAPAKGQTPFYDAPREILVIASGALHDARVRALGQAEDDVEDLRDLIAADKRRMALNAADFTPDIVTQAAVVAVMLLSEIGLSEAYEEAAEGEETAYFQAKSILTEIDVRVRAITSNPDTLMILNELSALMPSPTRPSRMDPDPEAAEAIGQSLVGALERDVAADLYLGRDLVRATHVIQTLFQDACDLPAGATRVQYSEIAAVYFQDTLQAPFSVMVPNATETIASHSALVGQDLDLDACSAISVAFDTIITTLFPKGAL